MLYPDGKGLHLGLLADKKGQVVSSLLYSREEIALRKRRTLFRLPGLPPGPCVLRDAVRDALRDATCDAVHDAVHDAMRDAMRNAAM